MAATTHAAVMARTEARARVDPAFVDLLARLVDLPVDTKEALDRAAASEVNQRRQREALDEFRAAALPTREVQALLGTSTSQSVHRLRSRGRLIGLAAGNQTWFPAWQFSGGRLRDDLPDLLDALSRFTTDAVAADRAMRVKRDDLGGRSIATLLDRPATRAQAWAALSELAG